MSAQTSPQPPQAPQAPTPSEADVAEGRQHFDRGVLLFDRGDNDGALVEFRRAWELSRRPTVLFNIAATCQALRRYGEAIEALERFLADAPSDMRRQRRDAETNLAELRQLVARVEITVQPADATLTLDGRIVRAGTSVVLGPGTHRADVARDGYRTRTEEFSLTSGENRALHFTLAPLGAVPAGASESTVAVLGTPPGASATLDGGPLDLRGPTRAQPGPHTVRVMAPGHRPWSGTVQVRPGTAHRLTVSLSREREGLPPRWFWIATATAGAMLVGTVVTGALALDANAQFRASPPGTPDLASLESRGRSFAVAADTMGVVCIAASVTAAVLYFRTDFHPTSSAEFALAPLPGGAAAHAVWSF